MAVGTTAVGRTAAGVVLVALAFLVCSASAAQAAFPGANGKIAVSAGTGGGADIWVMNPDGSGRVDVTNPDPTVPDNTYDQAPHWSPDGQKLIFTRDDQQAWVTNADGTIQTPVPILNARHASWSPDGQQVVFTRFAPGSSNCFAIYTANLDGTAETVVSPADAGPCIKSRPAWSPAGGLVAFEGSDPVVGFPHSYIYTVRLDGSNPSGPIAEGIAPTWSPAGHRIMYSAARRNPNNPYELHYDLYSFNPDGSGKLRLNALTGIEGEFGAWSPDGTAVVYSDVNSLWKVDDGGGSPVQLSAISDNEPDWQPRPPLPPPDPGYPRPRGASPLSVSLVPAYRECTNPNRTHGQPLAFGSCRPPQQMSDALTFGTPDANGQAARSVARVTFITVTDDPATPSDEADVKVSATLTDVRCRIALTGYCTDGALSDYLGKLELAPVIRITDRRSGGAERDPATGFDVVSFSVPITCTDTPSKPEGSTCDTQTSLDALAPGTIGEGKRAIWELGQVTVRDVGLDDPQVDGGTTFAVQGLFVP